MTTAADKVLLKQGSLVLKQCKKALLEHDMAVLQQQARILQVAAVASHQTLIQAEAQLLEQAAQQGQPRRAAEILMKIKDCLVNLAGDRAMAESLPDVPAAPATPAKKRPFIQRPQDDSYTKRLGNYLVEAELVTPAQIEVALADQRSTGARLGDILVARGWLRQGTIEFIMDRVVIPDRRMGQAESAPPVQAPPPPSSAVSNSANDRATLIDTQFPGRG